MDVEWIQNSVVRPHQASYLAERETETRDPGLREPMGFLILICLQGRKGNTQGSGGGFLRAFEGGESHEEDVRCGDGRGGCGVFGGLAWLIRTVCADPC